MKYICCGERNVDFIFTLNERGRGGEGERGRGGEGERGRGGEGEREKVDDYSGLYIT